MIRFFSDPRCLEHEVPTGFPEIPERLLSVLEGVRAAGFEIDEPGSHPQRQSTIESVHKRSYLDRFERAVKSGESFLDTGDNPICAATFDAASAAVDVVLHAADFVAAEAGNIGIAAVRPPGHHAEHAMSMGFCYFNNVAVGAEYLRKAYDFESVAIVDFDVHHGNGTQHIFESRSDVLYISSHRHPFYPGTGLAEEKGKGDGEGCTVNIPLPAGCGDDTHAGVFQEVIVPSLEEFNPQMLLISAGFDSWIHDPLGGMRVTESGFRDWGRWLGGIAKRYCDGRSLVVLEGGYDVVALPKLLLATVDGLEAA